MARQWKCLEVDGHYWVISDSVIMETVICGLFGFLCYWS